MPIRYLSGRVLEQLDISTERIVDSIEKAIVDTAGRRAWAAPKSVVFGPLPTTATGKIQKYVLRERARGGTGAAGG